MVHGPGTRLHIGTSGWHYTHWKGTFYPGVTGAGDFLAYYAGKFSTVEINNTFYHLPSDTTLQQWQQTVPADFRFAVKASRFITHMKKLKDGAATFQQFQQKIDVLGTNLGPVLFQLPPGWRCNPERLKDFLDTLPAGYRYAFEFRDASWFTDEIAALLSGKNAAFCIYELNGRRSPDTVTADFIYIRLHGPGGAYEGRYGRAGLIPWVEKITGWLRDGREVFIYFDNDEAGYAAQDALEMQIMISTA